MSTWLKEKLPVAPQHEAHRDFDRGRADGLEDAKRLVLRSQPSVRTAQYQLGYGVGVREVLGWNDPKAARP